MQATSRISLLCRSAVRSRSGFLAKFPLCDLSRQPLELVAVDYVAVHQADDKFFGRAAAEAVDDALHGADGDVLPVFGRAVDECAAVDFVAEEGFLFEAPQDRSDGRILQGACVGQRLAAGLGGARAVRPDVVHDHLFDFAEAFGAFRVGVSHCSVTICNVQSDVCQAER
jgi:hypothetical protein